MTLFGIFLFPVHISVYIHKGCVREVSPLRGVLSSKSSDRSQRLGSQGCSLHSRVGVFKRSDWQVAKPLKQGPRQEILVAGTRLRDLPRAWTDYDYT